MSKDFSVVEHLFKDLIPEDDEAQLVIYVQGKKVIDTSTGVDPDAILPIYSVSKALCAIVVAKIVDDGLLDLQSPVSKYWPEFAASGKEKVTVRQMLSHQAGLPETRKGLSQEEIMSDHAGADLLARERPLWAPGSAFGYHGLTIGNLISELVFRITGKSVQHYYEDEIRSKVGADAYLGLPKNLHHRFMPSLESKLPREEAHSLSLYHHVFRIFIDSLDSSRNSTYMFSPEYLEFGQPAAGGVANARGIAEIFNWATGYGAKNSGISAKTLEDFSQVQVHGYDLVGEWPIASFGTVFMKPTSDKRFGSFRAFGHDGAAGALVFADPENEIVFSYVVRRFSHPGGLDPKLAKIIYKLHEVINEN